MVKVIKDREGLKGQESEDKTQDGQDMPVQLGKEVDLKNVP